MNTNFKRLFGITRDGSWVVYVPTGFRRACVRCSQTPTRVQHRLRRWKLERRVAANLSAASVAFGASYEQVRSRSFSPCFRNPRSFSLDPLPLPPSRSTSSKLYLLSRDLYTVATQSKRNGNPRNNVTRRIIKDESHLKDRHKDFRRR